MWRTFYQLTKPGIVYGNSIAAIAGFLFAANGHVAWGLFAATIGGLALVIASACVINNYIDRNIDRKMKRTKGRALVIGTVSPLVALGYGVLLGAAGFTSLLLGVHLLAAGVAAVGMFFYLVLYGLGKRATVHGTLIGSVSGAIPPVVGYVAVTNHLDLPAMLIFGAMACWQMPHFYAIALFRMEEYAAAGIPTLPFVKGVHAAVWQIILYIIGFVALASSLTVIGATGVVYLLGILALGGAWLWKARRGFTTKNHAQWARGMFGFSLLVLLGFCALLSLNAFVV